MRLGAQVFANSRDPEVIAKAHKELGYRAAYCPEVSLSDKARLAQIREAFAKHELVIAEVGVWNNLMDTDESKRQANLAAMKEGMVLAEEIGALCLVNIAGSFNPTNWAGPHPDNLSQRAFDLAVQNAREVIDEVQPKRAKFTYEMMPFCLPHTADIYLEMIKAVDRPAFGVHMDAVNLINSVEACFDSAPVIMDCFAKLGPHIASCHVKDIKLDETALTPRFDEVMPGEGWFDLATYLKEIERLPHQPPAMIEHLKTKEEFDQAREYIMTLGKKVGVQF